MKQKVGSFHCFATHTFSTTVSLLDPFSFGPHCVVVKGKGLQCNVVGSQDIEPRDK